MGFSSLVFLLGESSNSAHIFISASIRFHFCLIAMSCSLVPVLGFRCQVHVSGRLLCVALLDIGRGLRTFDLISYSLLNFVYLQV